MIKRTMKILICNVLKYEVSRSVYMNAQKYCSTNLTFNNALVM
jgi:hypothetical protein